VRFRLIESGLIRARIDCEKQIAFLHVGAILKMAPDDHTTHLRRHLHSLVSCTCADLIQVKRHVLCDDFGDTCGTRNGLSSFNVNGVVLKNSVSDEPGQPDEKQVRPFWNSLVRSAGSLRFGPSGALGNAVIHDLLIAHRRSNFHFDPLRIAPFLRIGSPRLAWPLCRAKRRATALSPRERSFSLFSARSLIRDTTFM